MMTLVSQQKLFFAISVVLPFFLLPLFAYAQSSDNFTVRQQVGADTQPPTTPAFITAAPVASSQIDVTWGAATDDYEMGGYRLYRDALQIATTTQTSYSDTGLTPSTTYSYTVEAFDAGLRTSTSTGPVATTTLAFIAPPVTPTSTSNAGNTGAGALRVVLRDFELNPQTDSATIAWETNRYTRYVLRWGLSTSHEMGFVQSDVYKREHFTRIEGLVPDTEYQYELLAYDDNDRRFTLRSEAFVTDSLPDRTAPANVTDLRAVVESASVYLSWVNPVATDFDKLRVVRNYLFYPTDPTDGFIVYEGDAESMFDAEALESDTTQYYTVFTYDKDGNVSSGAIVFALRGDASASENTPESDASEAWSDTESDVTGSSTETEVSPLTALTFADVTFWQDGARLPQGDGNVVVRDNLPVTVQLAAELLPRHLKTVTVTIYNSSDESNAYILRINGSGSAYEARIATLPEGAYTAQFSLYDFKQRTQSSFSGEIISAPETVSFIPEQDSVFVSLTNDQRLLVYVFTPSLILLLLVLWWYFFVLRRSAEDN